MGPNVEVSRDAHWTRKIPELWGLTLALSCFGYTGALEPNMAAAMIATALAGWGARKLLHWA